ncbi:MAG: hypothetical protein QOG15_3390 [Solirubrobacteraceae bacterium]|nr:hypothetical protein [Solirubrobacteraceae bacterium]
MRLVLLGLLTSLLWTSPAAAFSPPALYVRLAHANSIDHTPVSDWMPLASSPSLNWLGGYEIGYALESPGAQHTALQITGVPDGQPTQPLNTPFCNSGLAAPAGSIVPVGVEIQFEGGGVYSVRVGVGPASGGPNDCLTGAGSVASTGSFTVAVPVAPSVVGSPLVFRAKRLPDGAFSGVRSNAPAGGEADTRCARDAAVNPDGSVTGKLVVPASVEGGVSGQIAEGDFGRPGAWTCVARGSVIGTDTDLNQALYGMPWSAPLRLDVRSDFRRAKGVISKPSSKHPTIRLTAEFPEVAEGAVGKLTLRRLAGCKDTKPILKTVGTFKGRFGADGRATVKLRRPRPAYYVGTVSFSGTRFYTKSVDPNPALLRVSDTRKLSYVSPLAFPQCPF